METYQDIEIVRTKSAPPKKTKLPPLQLEDHIVKKLTAAMPGLTKNQGVIVTAKATVGQIAASVKKAAEGFNLVHAEVPLDLRSDVMPDGYTSVRFWVKGGYD